MEIILKKEQQDLVDLAIRSVTEHPEAWTTLWFPGADKVCDTMAFGTYFLIDSKGTILQPWHFEPKTKDSQILKEFFETVVARD